MSTITKPKQSGEAAIEKVDKERDFEALCNFIDFSQGSFSFGLVKYDLPRALKHVIDRIKKKFSGLNIALVNPAEKVREYRYENVLDQLDKVVKTALPDKRPDLLIIKGYEQLLPDDSNPKDENSRTQLKDAIQPLNLGRNILKSTYPCPVLLCLPVKPMGLFLRSAPDLVSWGSGYFQFLSDIDRVRNELEKEAKSGVGWWERRKFVQQSRQSQKPDELRDSLFNETERLKELIADAEALPAETPIRLRLYERWGWTAAALGNRTDARKAFAEMKNLAGDDRRVIRAAEKGEQAVSRMTVSVAVPLERAAELLKTLPGASILTERAELFGRDEKLRDLVEQMTRVETRFYTVWGETGCGKSSLIQAGLVPELEKRGWFHPIVVRDWNDPLSNVRRALEQKSGISLENVDSLFGCIQQAAQQTKKNVVIVCDQFEQFFVKHEKRSEREPFLKAIGKCYDDFSLPCKFLFVIRSDELGLLTEFDEMLPEPLERRKRLQIPLFSAPDAEQVLQKLSEQKKLEWTPDLIKAVVEDLTVDGHVRPVKFQLIAATLAVSGIIDVRGYAGAGGASGLLEDYLELVLRSVEDSDHRSEDMKRVLLAIIDEDEKHRLPPSSAEEISGRSGVQLQKAEKALIRLEETRLIRRVGDPSSSDRYELIHDFLVKSVIDVTSFLHDDRIQANRILRRALVDSIKNPKHRIGLKDSRRVVKHADSKEKERPEAISLVRRSLIWGIILWLVLPPTLLISILFALQSTTSYVSLERDFNERVVMRRGLPWLTFLPLSNGIVLDTGFNVDDLDKMKVERGFRPIHWEFGNQQSGILDQDDFKNAVSSSVKRGILLCQVGRIDEGFPLLLVALKDSDSSVRSVAAGALREAAKAAPTEAARVIDPLVAALKDSDDSVRSAARAFSVRSAAARALVEAAKTASTEAARVIDLLVALLKDSDSYVRSAAAGALGKAAKAAPTEAARVIDPLLAALKDSDSDVRSAAAASLGLMAQVNNDFVNKAFGLLSDYDPKIRQGVQTPLIELIVLRAEKEDAPIQFLFDHLEGRKSLMPNGDANTYAVYRNVIVGAMAKWLESDSPKAIASKAELKRKLEFMRDNEKRLHLRIAAWNVLAQVNASRPEDSDR